MAIEVDVALSNPYECPSPFEVLYGAVPLPIVHKLASFVDQMIGARRAPDGEERELLWFRSVLDLIRAGRIPNAGSLFGFLSSTSIPDRARAVLGEDLAVSIQGSSVRDFRPDLRSDPARMHYDVTVLGLSTPMVTVWIPLDPVGVVSPSLAMCTKPYWPSEHWRRTVESFDENGMLRPRAGRKLSFGHEEIYACAAEEEEWPFVEPTLALGDAMLFDHQRIHGTQLLDTPARRRSMEIRFCSVESAERVAKLAPGTWFLRLAN